MKAELDLSNAALGAGIALGPAGALLASSVAGWLVARLGSGRLAVAASVVYGLTLPLIGFAPSWLAFAAAVSVLGLCDGAADVAQNAHGLRVQRVYGRSLINGFHAWWSIGGVVGGLTAAGAASLDVPLTAHLAIAGGVLAVAALIAGQWTLPGADHDVDHSAEPSEPAVLTLAGVAGLTLLASFVEDVPGSWGAVYLRDELSATAGAAGLAFAAFTAGMTAGRLGADRAVDRWGHVSVVRASGGVAATGLAGAIVIGTPWAGLLGFLLVGLGAAPSFPALFHAAGHWRGVRPADGVALVSWSARVGFLISPPMIGILADATSLTWAIGVGVLAAVGVVAGASTLRPRR